MGLDEQQVRAQFPALTQDQVFFDNAGGSQTLGPVIDSITAYLSRTNVQLGASYATGKEATARYSDAFAAAARYINANVDDIVFGSSTTQLFRNLSWSLEFQPGDEILISALDHEANIAPWVDLARRQDLRLYWWKPREDRVSPELTAEALRREMSHLTRLRLVTFTHASNVLGTIHDVKAISKVAHEYGALVCVDGVAYAPHRPIDVEDLDVDFYSFSWYKVYGPHVAMLYSSWPARQKVRSLGHFFNPQQSLTDRLGLAGASYELLQSIPQVVEYLGTHASERWQDVVAHEEKLQEELLSYLRERSDVTIYGRSESDPSRRVPTVSFVIKGWDSKEVVETVETHTKYGFRWGAFYSERLVRDVLSLGPQGVVRVSMVHYNTLEEVQGLVKAFQEHLPSRS
ncbi:hypothetical protein NLU13_2156 [Sarocladium strictum]|uniref:Aminotransferase class V domain-containing protein n=1 Tax=Sarocladium strictum TaxID=5046 RepID=A0AA39GSJ8_SARSR|nr:hypothetical protein NLU13_2156 [Sarocladium strictum]